MNLRKLNFACRSRRKGKDQNFYSFGERIQNLVSLLSRCFPCISWTPVIQLHCTDSEHEVYVPPIAGSNSSSQTEPGVDEEKWASYVCRSDEDIFPSYERMDVSHFQDKDSIVDETDKNIINLQNEGTGQVRRTISSGTVVICKGKRTENMVVVGRSISRAEDHMDHSVELSRELNASVYRLYETENGQWVEEKELPSTTKRLKVYSPNGGDNDSNDDIPGMLNQDSEMFDESKNTSPGAVQCSSGIQDISAEQETVFSPLVLPDGNFIGKKGCRLSRAALAINAAKMLNNLLTEQNEEDFGLVSGIHSRIQSKVSGFSQSVHQAINAFDAIRDDMQKRQKSITEMCNLDDRTGSSSSRSECSKAKSSRIVRDHPQEDYESATGLRNISEKGGAGYSQSVHHPTDSTDVFREISPKDYASSKIPSKLPNLVEKKESGHVKPEQENLSSSKTVRDMPTNHHKTEDPVYRLGPGYGSFIAIVDNRSSSEKKNFVASTKEKETFLLEDSSGTPCTKYILNTEKKQDWSMEMFNASLPFKRHSAPFDNDESSSTLKVEKGHMKGVLKHDEPVVNQGNLSLENFTKSHLLHEFSSSSLEPVPSFGPMKQTKKLKGILKSNESIVKKKKSKVSFTFSNQEEEDIDSILLGALADCTIDDDDDIEYRNKYRQDNKFDLTPSPSNFKGPPSRRGHARPETDVAETRPTSPETVEDKAPVHK